MEALNDPDKIVIFQTAPAVRVGLGEAFGMEPGSFVEGKMVSAFAPSVQTTSLTPTSVPI